MQPTWASPADVRLDRSLALRGPRLSMREERDSLGLGSVVVKRVLPSDDFYAEWTDGGCGEGAQHAGTSS